MAKVARVPPEPCRNCRREKLRVDFIVRAQGYSVPARRQDCLWLTSPRIAERLAA